jgi:hypothetical protein
LLLEVILGLSEIAYNHGTKVPLIFVMEQKT